MSNKQCHMAVRIYLSRKVLIERGFAQVIGEVVVLQRFVYSRVVPVDEPAHGPV